MILENEELVCRVALGVLILGAAVIGAPARRRADREGGVVSRAVDPPWFWLWMWLVGPPVPLACLGFMIEPSWVEFAAMGVPAGWRLPGIPVGVAGLGLFAWVFRHLGLNVTSTSMPREEGSLVTSGPYRWVRHPMYTASGVLWASATLLTGNLIVAVGGAGALGLMLARSGEEERRLVGKFGDAYRVYRSRTGRFWPRWGS